MLSSNDEALVKVLGMKERSEALLNGSNPHGYDFSLDPKQWSDNQALYYLQYVQGLIGIKGKPVVPKLEQIYEEAIEQLNQCQRSIDTKSTYQMFKQFAKAIEKAIILSRVIKALKMRGYRILKPSIDNTTIDDECTSVYVRSSYGNFWFVVSNLIGKTN